nr:hypothetical protein [Tanacetum cinerariifolium]
MTCQIVQKKLEEKQIEEEQAAKAQNRKLPVCYDDDDDEEESNSLKANNIFELPPCSVVTPSEPIDSISMGDERLDTISATESDEFIKSCIENLVPNPKFNSKNSNAEIESFSPSPILNEDSDSFMEEINLFLTPDDPMPPSIKDDEDSEGDILFERLLHDDPIPLPD